MGQCDCHNFLAGWENEYEVDFPGRKGSEDEEGLLIFQPDRVALVCSETQMRGGGLTYELKMMLLIPAFAMRHATSGGLFLGAPEAWHQA